MSHAADAAAQLRAALQALRGGQAGQARQLCEQVLQRDPGQADAWRLLALAKQALHDSAGAGDALAHAHASRPHDPGIAFERGSWLLQRILPLARDTHSNFASSVMTKIQSPATHGVAMPAMLSSH